MERAEIQAELQKRFGSPAGTERLQVAYSLVIECAKAMCDRDEMLATLIIEAQIDREDATLILDFAAEDIEMAALASRARLRREILAACNTDSPSAARVGILKEFAYQHLDWSRKPLDDETRDALKEADKVRRQGTSE